MLYSYSFKDTNSVNKLSSISVNVIDFFKPRRTWSPLSLIRFHARPLSRVTVGRLLTLRLLGQVLRRHDLQVNSLRFGDTELLRLGQGDPVTLQLVLTINVPLDGRVVFLCLSHPLQPNLSVPLWRLCHCHEVVDQELVSFLDIADCSQ